MTNDDKHLRQRLEELYQPASDDSFVRDTLNRLPHGYARLRLRLVLFFILIWGTFFGLVIHFRSLLYAALKDVLYTIGSWTLPSTSDLIALILIFLLFVLAVHESCDAVTRYIDRQYEHDQTM